MICVVIKGPSLKAAQEQIQAALTHADLVELRLDLFDDLDIGQLKCPLPMILTLRVASQGGKYNGDEKERLATIRRLAALKPAYIDLESHVDPAFVKEMPVPVILSHHDFTETPQDIDKVYQEMTKTPAALYKLAFKANSTSDMLRLLTWINQSPKNVIAISMDTYGQPSRIVGPVVGSKITYACLDQELQTAPGQLSARELRELFHYQDLNPQTALYGIIGYPLTASMSQHTHNHVLKTLGLNGVYLKMPLQDNEMHLFFEMIRKLPFKGLSVTVPHKERVIPFLDAIDPKAEAIGAVNTIVWEEGRLKGYNTDCIGALDALEQDVRGKKVMIIGAGGSAKAIAYEAVKRGALVTILNRTVAKGEELAKTLGASSGTLTQIPSDYDILINSTSDQLPIDPTFLIPKATVMDIITRPKDTLLLKHAQEKGCKIVYGYNMFREQAIHQFELWFKGVDSNQVRRLLEERIQAIL